MTSISDVRDMPSVAEPSGLHLLLCCG